MSEIEAKFSVPDARRLDELETIQDLALLRVTSRRGVEIVDRYFDTVDRGLAAAHSSFRIRSIGGEQWYTYKVLEEELGYVRRLEIEERAGGRDHTGWLYSLVDSGRAPLEESPEDLQPVLEIRNTRTLLGLSGDDVGLELALDRVCFSGPRGEAEQFEVELELIAGREDVLREAAEELRERFHLQPQTASKYERALALVG